ncbi:MAG: glutamyl-tRNA reductase [Chloroflexota bacterium]|nr:glutamyl-tRNA reductase [Chloroflexota bacterium]
MPVPHIVVVGSNHEYAPVDVRERLAFSGDALVAGLHTLHDHVGEGLILSTCNRTEVYAVAETEARARSEIFSFLGEYHDVPELVLQRASYVHAGVDAVTHIFRVASGLDSMVLGEPQILSQIRDALKTAREAGAAGPILQRLATDALKTGKRARTETNISRNRVSIAHAAVDLARHELGTLAGRNAVILGAGKMATLTAKLLRTHDIGELTVINRSLDRAQGLARATGGYVIPISGLPQALSQADVVFGAVMVERPLVSIDDITERTSPLLLVDLGVPRTIDSECGTIDRVTVKDVDALEPLAEQTRRQYAAEVRKVESLIDVATTEFEAWTQGRAAATAIAAVRQRAESMRDSELERALRRLAHLPDRDRNVVRALAHALTNKTLHDPVIAMRHSSSEEELRLIQRAFGVDPDGTA